MGTVQPEWEYLTNIGDATPLEYGGCFLYNDRTGVYAPEMERIELVDESNPRSKYTIHRVILDRCTFIGGVLSDNKFHPEMSAWFADSLPSIAGFVGMSPT